MSYSRLNELWHLGASLLLSLLLGWVIGYPVEALFVAVAAWLVFYIYQLFRIERWLHRSKKIPPPQAAGLWGEVFTGIYRLQLRARKRNKRLIQAINRFRETTAALPDGVVVMKRFGEIEWWNDEAEKLLNLKYPQDVGQRLTNLLRHPAVTAYCADNDWSKPVIFTSPENESARISLRVVEYGKQQKLLILRDVTLFERVQQMRRDFVANISHELRTPLTVLSGYLESLAEELADKPELQRNVTTMQQQTRRMNQLTEDLILLSNFENNQQTHKEVLVDVPSMLVSLKEQMQVLSGERGHDILLEVEPDLLLRGDPKELDSVFTNLAVNAINYTPPGGAIRLRWYRDQTGAHFEVNDTGIGIAAHHLPRLTERFYRVDAGRSRKAGGSGLGLAIVKHGLQRNQGSLRIDSEVGRGSTFICDFDPAVVVQRAEAKQQART